ncbi:hypothetical protein GCM10009850_087430 [Nonomuraea monospora]|uniref:Uncharacterized protein n=1 Tax=Nonomuraea monospora TaxID=568818 RepID=A0ABN3CV94_9ACTN
MSAKRAYEKRRDEACGGLGLRETDIVISALGEDMSDGTPASLADRYADIILRHNGLGELRKLSVADIAGLARSGITGSCSMPPSARRARRLETSGGSRSRP